MDAACDACVPGTAITAEGQQAARVCSGEAQRGNGEGVWGEFWVVRESLERANGG